MGKPKSRRNIDRDMEEEAANSLAAPLEGGEEEKEREKEKGKKKGCRIKRGKNIYFFRLSLNSSLLVV